jgi:predicted molibdopterin-dependent oxidoreductase YjgC
VVTGKFPASTVLYGGARRGAMCTIIVDGEQVPAFSGETIAGVMLRLGRRALRVSLHHREPRGYFCGMGSCYECVVRVDRRERPACVTAVVEGMRVETGTREAR